MIGKQRTWLRVYRPDSSTRRTRKRPDRRYRRLGVERIEDRLLLSAGPSPRPEGPPVSVMEGGFVEFSLSGWATASGDVLVLDARSSNYGFDSDAKLSEALVYSGDYAQMRSIVVGNVLTGQKIDFADSAPGGMIGFADSAPGGMIDVTYPTNEQLAMVRHRTSPGEPGLTAIVSRESGDPAASETVEKAGRASAEKQTLVGRDTASAFTLTGLDGSRGRFRAFEVATWDGPTRAGVEAAVSAEPEGFSAVSSSRLESYDVAPISPGFSSSGDESTAARPQPSHARLAEVVPDDARLRVDASHDVAGRSVSPGHDAVFAEIAVSPHDFSDSVVYLGEDRRIEAAAALLVASMAGPTVLRWRKAQRRRWVDTALFWRPEMD